MEHTYRSTARSTTQRRTVLLVDDEEFLRRMLARVLDEAGFDVVEAPNGMAALELAHEVDGHLSLVVTDVHMPMMDGIEFARAFRPLHPGVPLLFITGRDPAETDDPVYFNSHLLRKPFRSEAFVATVDRLLGERTDSPVRNDSIA
jgi:two-component system, cell cycle sensor histidine kinase and response regulator CckA